MGRFTSRRGGGNPPSGRRTRGSPWFYLLCPLPIFLCLMAFVWPRLEVVRQGYDFHRLQSERSQLSQLNAELKVERARLRSLSRIEQVARRDLGMGDPKPGQLIWVRLSSKGVPPVEAVPSMRGEPGGAEDP